MQVRIGHLYADELNLYGDRGNVIALARRLAWHGYEAKVEPIGLGRHDLAPYDLLVIGGGEDRAQERVAADLVEVKGPALKRALAEGTVLLAVCGGYQLLGERYVTADGRALPGLGLLPVVTENGPGRLVGNAVLEVPWLGGSTVVGFENHGGRTRLLPGATPFGRVLRGYGNNGEDGSEGAVAGRVFGTYLHGALLPKNPHLADHLIALALERRGGARGLRPLPDRAERRAHRALLQRLRVVPRGWAAGEVSEPPAGRP